MRNRRTMSNEGPGLMPMIGIGLVVVVVVAAISFTIYGGSVQPATSHIEQVVPDDRLPH